MKNKLIIKKADSGQDDSGFIDLIMNNFYFFQNPPWDFRINKLLSN